MKKHLWGIIFLMIPAVFSFGEEINAVLATVNGQPVFLGDILPVTRNEEYQAYAALKGEALEKRIRELRSAAVNEVIDQRLLQEAYGHESFELPRGMIEQRMDAYAEQLGCRSRQEFAALLRKEKTSVEEVRKFIVDRLTAEIMLYRQIQPRVHVSPREVYEFYRNNPKRFCTDEHIRLGLILLKKEGDGEKTGELAAKISAILKDDPGAFEKLAAEYSSGPNAADGGDLGMIRKELLREEFAKVISVPEKGKIHGPVATSDGTAFIKILDYQQENKVEFRTVAPEIQRELEGLQRKEAIENYLKELRSRAVIRFFF